MFLPCPLALSINHLLILPSPPVQNSFIGNSGIDSDSTVSNGPQYGSQYICSPMAFIFSCATFHPLSINSLFIVAFLSFAYFLLSSLSESISLMAIRGSGS